MQKHSCLLLLKSRRENEKGSLESSLLVWVHFLPTSIPDPTVPISTLLAASMGFPGGSVVKESACQCRRRKRCKLILGLERSLGVGNDNPFQYSCLENSMDRGAWQATVGGVANSWTQFSIHTHIGIYTAVIWFNDVCVCFQRPLLLFGPSLLWGLRVGLLFSHNSDNSQDSTQHMLHRPTGQTAWLPTTWPETELGN